MQLSPHLLLSAYMQGVFPMADEDGEIFWYDPDPRAILPLDNFHVSRSLQRTVRQGRFEVRLDSSFADVIHACAMPQEDRHSTWISKDIVDGYVDLHRLGYAHSVETWMEGELVGGLYGVALNGLFAGESMFSTRRDASKIALVYLVKHLRNKGFTLLDIQFMTDHLQRFGAVEIPRGEYHARLARAVRLPVSF
jgi:leucyl/phenylalanyl-tRNA--protein transferase